MKPVGRIFAAQGALQRDRANHPGEPKRLTAAGAAIVTHAETRLLVCKQRAWSLGLQVMSTSDKQQVTSRGQAGDEQEQHQRQHQHLAGVTSK